MSIMSLISVVALHNKKVSTLKVYNTIFFNNTVTYSKAVPGLENNTLPAIFKALKASYYCFTAIRNQGYERYSLSLATL